MRYKVKGPDGVIHEIEGPEGASDDEIIAQAQKLFPAKKYASPSDDPSKVGLLNAAASLDQGIYNVGGKATDLASNLGASPEVAGGVGYGTNLGLQLLTSGMGMGLGKTTSPLVRAAGEKLMVSALKPTYEQWKSGEAKSAIQALLDNGINATNGGVRTLKTKIGEINDQIKAAIANSTETVSKYDVASRLNDVMNRFTKQVNPQTDLNAIQDTWSRFLAHPELSGKNQIPVQLAQDMKTGTYRQLSDQYGELSTATKEAQKALARGLKEEIGTKVPEVVQPLSVESKLINALNVTERRALMDLNKNPAGLALLANNKAAALGFMADKSALFKSLLARMLYSGQSAIPGSAGAIAGAGAGAYMGEPPDVPQAYLAPGMRPIP